MHQNVSLSVLSDPATNAEKRSFRQAAIELGLWESTICRVFGNWKTRLASPCLFDTPVA
jgi:hypothetical protein